MNKPRAAATPIFRHGKAGLETAIGIRQGSPAKGEWGYPGGHVEPHESPRDAASRELVEEAGIYIEPGNFTYIITQQNTHEVFIFAAVVDEKAQLKSGSDMGDMRWMLISQLPKLAFNGNNYIEKAMRKLKLLETTPAVENIISTIASMITEDPDIITEVQCTACGGWDITQGGIGHKRGCKVGTPGSPVMIHGSVECPQCKSRFKPQYKYNDDPDARPAMTTCDNCGNVFIIDDKLVPSDPNQDSHTIQSQNMCMNCGQSISKCGCDISLRHWNP